MVVPQLLNKLLAVVAFVGTQGDPLLPWNLLDHRQRGLQALRGRRPGSRGR